MLVHYLIFFHTRMEQVEKAWLYLRKSKYNDIMDSDDLKEGKEERK